MKNKAFMSGVMILIIVTLSSLTISLVDKKHACVTRENGTTGPGLIYALEVAVVTVVLFALYEAIVRVVLKRKGSTERTGFASFTPFA